MPDRAVFVIRAADLKVAAVPVGMVVADARAEVVLKVPLALVDDTAIVEKLPEAILATVQAVDVAVVPVAVPDCS